MESQKSHPTAANIKTARYIFNTCAIFGILILTSMYIRTPPIMPKAPREQPEMYFGFAGVSLAWQIIFLSIAKDPIRYRPLMLISALAEKLGFALTLTVLLILHRAGHHWIPTAILEASMGLAFLYAFKITGTAKLDSDFPG